MNANKTLWLVGQWMFGEYPNCVWEFQGIFETEEEAVAVALSRNDNYFVAPVELGELLCDETISFPRAYYPAQGKPSEAKF